MNFNEIHITISIAALITIISLFLKADSWFRNINSTLKTHGDDLDSLKKSHLKLRRYNRKLRNAQISIINDLNAKHSSNVEAIKNLVVDLERLEDKVEGLADSQDDIIRKLDKCPLMPTKIHVDNPKTDANS